MNGASLTYRTRFGYGIADFGLNLFYTYLNLFLLIYYTDVLLIPPAIAGLIFAAGVVWDGLTDLPMGYLAGRTRTKYGSYRPYILFGAPILGLSFVLMFAMPLVIPGAVVVASIIAHLIFRACFTVVAIPHAAMLANLTRDSQERSILAGFRMVFGPLGGVFAAVLSWDLAEDFGDGDMVVGFFWVSVLYACIAVGVFWVTFAMTKENPVGPETVRPPLADLPRLFLENKPLLILLAAIIANSIGHAVFTSALAHYVIYVSPADIELPSVMLTVLVTVTVGVPFWSWMSRFVSKRACWVSGAAIAVVAQAIVFASVPSSAAILISLLAITGFGTSAYIVMMWAMLPDTVEYGQWKSGFRDEGVVFGVNQLSIKAANGLGIALLGGVLSIAGFVANTEQSDGAVSAINAATFLSPVLCTALAACIVSFYSIDRSFHARLVDEIES